jgi:Na+-transporting methylmalonyl-CoA/oxaloacetate decarboxylase gamma subunit
MRNVILLALCLFGFALLSAQATTEVVPDSLANIGQLAANHHVPVKKLIQELNLPMGTAYTTMPKDVHLSHEQVQAAIQNFQDHRMNFGGILTLLGMSVVFAALAITATILSQFHRFNRENKPVKPVQKEVVKPMRGDDAYVAAMVALYMHNQEIRERNKLLLTWRRAPVSMWKASAIVEMPNREYYERGGRA